MFQSYFRMLASRGRVSRGHDPRLARCSAMKFAGGCAAALLALLMGTGTARARTDGSCESSLAPRVVVTGSEDRGGATIRITSPESRPGMIAHVEYDGETYAARFDEMGVAKVGAAIFSSSNEFTISVKGIGSLKCTVPFPEIQDVYRVVLRWHDPVKFDLHVIEPFAMESTDGHIYPGRPNLGFDHGLGRMDIITDAGEEDATAEQSYVIDEARRPPKGIFTFRADYASRGALPEGEFCGEGKFANVEFVLITLDHGKRLPAKKYATGTMACGQILPHDVEFQRLK